jgi:hypothetical protein
LAANSIYFSVQEFTVVGLTPRFLFCFKKEQGRRIKKEKGATVFFTPYDVI